MLDNRDCGFAIMNKELTGYSFEDTNLETCKRYCRNGDVIVKRISYVSGFEIRIKWLNRWYDPICLKGSYKNIFWLNWSTNKVYSHKSGKIVYRSE